MNNCFRNNRDYLYKHCIVVYYCYQDFYMIYISYCLYEFTPPTLTCLRRTLLVTIWLTSSWVMQKKDTKEEILQFLLPFKNNILTPFLCHLKFKFIFSNLKLKAGFPTCPPASSGCARATIRQLTPNIAGRSKELVVRKNLSFLEATRFLETRTLALKF